MATAEELGGSRTPVTPKPKSTRTVTFVGPDGSVLPVVSDISKSALAVLRKLGYKKESEAIQEQEEAALAKEETAEEAVAKRTPRNKPTT
jgi:hypothetical protein